MPETNAKVIAKRSELVRQFREFLPEDSVIDDQQQLKVYETDGLTAYHQLPMIVTLPQTTAQVSKILKICASGEIKVVPRGAGTGLSGGALPLADGVTVGLAKFNEILDIDYGNRCPV